MADNNFLCKQDPIDHESLLNSLNALLAERDQHLREYFEKMHSIVDQINARLGQFTSTQDPPLMEICHQEAQLIKNMQEEQEQLRDQIVRFVQATSSSFQQIFQQGPSP